MSTERTNASTTGLLAVDGRWGRRTRGAAGAARRVVPRAGRPRCRTGHRASRTRRPGRAAGQAPRHHRRLARHRVGHRRHPDAARIGRLRLLRHVGAGGRRAERAGAQRRRARRQLHQRGRRRRPDPVSAQRDGAVDPQRVGAAVGARRVPTSTWRPCWSRPRTAHRPSRYSTATTPASSNPVTCRAASVPGTSNAGCRPRRAGRSWRAPSSRAWPPDSPAASSSPPRCRGSRWRPCTSSAGAPGNRLLCQLVANRVDRPVIAGPRRGDGDRQRFSSRREATAYCTVIPPIFVAAWLLCWQDCASCHNGLRPEGFDSMNQKTKRRLPSVHDLAPLMQFKKPEFDATKRRLDKALTIADLRRIAKRRTPRAAFDYTDGSAEAELSIARARQAFLDIEFHPAILRDVSKVHTGWDVLGAPVSLPFGIAPTGFTRMMHTEGEIAGAHAAAKAGIPFALSTMGTTSIEEVKAENPLGRNWFQLYMWKDRERSMALVERGRHRGVRHPAGDSRRPRRGSPAARRAQRHVDPACADPAHGRQRAAAAAVVDRLPDHRAAGVRLAGSLVGHRGRTARHDVRPRGDLRRPGLDQVPVARQVRGQGNPDRRRRPRRRRPRRRRRPAVQSRWAPTRSGTDPVPPAARRGPPRSGARSRSCWTRASCPAPTWWPPSRWERGSR